MPQKEQITSTQIAMMMFLCIMGTALLMLPGITAAISGNDMWMTPLLGSIAGYLIVWCTWRLHRMYPGDHFIGILQKALGPVAGTFLGIVFVLFHIHITGITMRSYAEFLAGNFFERTPLFFLVASMTLVAAIAVKAGAEAFARCSQIFLPVVLLLILLNFALLLPELKPMNLLPVLGNGMTPVVKGTLVVQGWYCQFMLISFFYPYLHESKRSLRVGMASVAGVMAAMLISNMTLLFLFGNVTAKFNYPFLMASRYIRVGDFVEHVEAMVMMIWVLGAFVKITAFYYVAAAGFANVFRVNDYRLFVYPVGLVIAVMSMWVAPNMQELANFLSTNGTFYILSGYLVFPFLVLAVAWLRRRASARRA